MNLSPSTKTKLCRRFATTFFATCVSNITWDILDVSVSSLQKISKTYISYHIMLYVWYWFVYWLTDIHVLFLRPKHSYVLWIPLDHGVEAAQRRRFGAPLGLVATMDWQRSEWCPKFCCYVIAWEYGLGMNVKCASNWLGVVPWRRSNKPRKSSLGKRRFSFGVFQSFWESDCQMNEPVADIQCLIWES